eukprot:5939543-Amphidinium_carterae.1
MNKASASGAGDSGFKSQTGLELLAHSPSELQAYLTSPYLTSPGRTPSLLDFTRANPRLT